MAEMQIKYGFYTNPKRNVSTNSKGVLFDFVPQSVGSAVFGQSIVFPASGEHDESTNISVLETAVRQAVSVTEQDFSLTAIKEITLITELLSALRQADYANTITTDTSLIVDGEDDRKLQREVQLSRASNTPSPNNGMSFGTKEETKVYDTVHGRTVSKADSEVLSGDTEDQTVDHIFVDEDSSEDPLTVLQYPGLDTPISVFDYEDLQPDASYLVVNRATRSSTKPNQVWIWIGSEAAEEDTTDSLMQRYEAWKDDDQVASASDPVGTACRVARATTTDPTVFFETEEDDDFVELF